MSPLQVLSGLNTHLPHTYLLLQDPVAADKLTKIQKDLDETKVILHQTIDSVLRRGEKLDTLVEKSADLSLASKMFAKQASKTNSCCRMS
jgi:synaptobrevin family protein YKT6